MFKAGQSTQAGEPKQPDRPKFSAIQKFTTHVACTVKSGCDLPNAAASCSVTLGRHPFFGIAERNGLRKNVSSHRVVTVGRAARCKSVAARPPFLGSQPH